MPDCFENIEAYFEATCGWSMQGRLFLSNFHGYSAWGRLSHPWSKFHFGFFVFRFLVCSCCDFWSQFTLGVGWNFDRPTHRQTIPTATMKRTHGSLHTKYFTLLYRSSPSLVSVPSLPPLRARASIQRMTNSDGSTRPTSTVLLRQHAPQPLCHTYG